MPSVTCKQNPVANLTADSIADAIKSSVWPLRGEGVWSVKELKGILGLEERQAYRKVNGEAEWNGAEILMLVRESILKNGSPLLDLLLPEGFEIFAVTEQGNGFFEDLAEETEEIGSAISDLKAGNLAKCGQDLNAAQNTLNKIKADVRNSKGHGTRVN